MTTERKFLTDVTADGWDAIHTWFSLSYSSYLVLPRAMMEAMPNAWQLAMVALLEEMEQTIDYDKLYPDGMRYMVKRRGDKGVFLPDPLSNYRHPIPIPFRPEATHD